MRRELGYFVTRIGRMLLAVSVLVLAGGASFAHFEDESLWDGFQRALVTVAMVGSMGAPESLGGEITQVVLPGECTAGSTASATTT